MSSSDEETSVSVDSFRVCSKAHWVALSSRHAVELVRRKNRVMKTCRGRPIVEKLVNEKAKLVFGWDCAAGVLQYE